MSQSSKNAFSKSAYILLFLVGVSSASFGAESDDILDIYPSPAATSSFSFSGSETGYSSSDGNPSDKEECTQGKKRTIEEVNDESYVFNEQAVAPLAGEDSVLALSQALGTTPRRAAGIQLLDRLNYAAIEFSSPSSVNPSELTPIAKEKYKYLRQKDVPSPTIREEMYLFKRLNPSPIRDITNYQQSAQLPGTPSARHYLSRTEVNEAREKKLIKSIPPLAYTLPIAAETPEERAARKIRQKAEFAAVFEAQEAALQLSLNPSQSQDQVTELVSDLLKKELAIALSSFQKYFAYLGAKKARYLKYVEDRQNQKALIKMKRLKATNDEKDKSMTKEEIMRWPDVVGAFNQFVAPSMIRLEIEDYEVYFTFKTLNFNRTNMATGLPNHQAMKLGYSPTGADGEPMNLHHVTQLDPHVHKVTIDAETMIAQEGPYKLVLIPASLHSEYSGSLHFESETYVLPKLEIDRSAFGKSRDSILKKIVELYYKD